MELRSGAIAPMHRLSLFVQVIVMTQKNGFLTASTEHQSFDASKLLQSILSVLFHNHG